MDLAVVALPLTELPVEQIGLPSAIGCKEPRDPDSTGRHALRLGAEETANQKEAFRDELEAVFAPMRQ